MFCANCTSVGTAHVHATAVNFTTACRINMGAAYSTSTLAQRSYLGHILPESLIYCLDTYGPEVRL